MFNLLTRKLKKQYSDGRPISSSNRPANPFTYCGIVYVGPFERRMSKGYGATVLKGYVALFV